MFKKFDPSLPYFASVALFFILLGAIIFAVGIVEWILNLGFYEYSWPLFKVVSGVVIMALGYIHFELELMRIGAKK